MKLFFTGGSGFVGQNVIPVLLEQGFEVFALARSKTSARKVKQSGAKPILDDLENLSLNSRKALEECECVVHSAAYMDFTFDPKPYFALNVNATKELLALAKGAGIKKFVYISAAPVVPGSPIIKLSEQDATDQLPKDLYPKTKALAEKAVLKANSPTFKTVSIRPPAIWGPDNHHYEELFDNVKSGRWRWIGGGHQILSTIHVKNLASAVVAALHSDKSGSAYFVTDGDYRSMRTTFSEIMKAYGLDPGEKELPRGVANLMASLCAVIWKTFRLKSRPPIAPLMIRLMATEFSVDDRKARDELGYENVLSFEEGVEQLKHRNLGQRQ